MEQIEDLKDINQHLSITNKELMLKIEELESELGKAEDENTLLREIIKSLSEVL